MYKYTKPKLNIVISYETRCFSGTTALAITNYQCTSGSEASGDEYCIPGGTPSSGYCEGGSTAEGYINCTNGGAKAISNCQTGYTVTN